MLTSPPGTTLEYDDVRSRVKPAHDRCGHGPSRPVCVTDRRKPLFSYGAKLAHLSVQTRADLGRFHALLMDPPPTWHGEKNRKTSADKIVQRIRGMLGWLSAVAKRADVADVKLTDLVPSADEEGAELVEEFVNWLRAERATVDATLHANYQSLLHLAMYLYHKESKVSAPLWMPCTPSAGLCCLGLLLSAAGCILAG